MNTWICDSCGDRLAHDGKQSYSVEQKELSERAEKAEAAAKESEARATRAWDDEEKAARENETLRARVAELEAAIQRGLDMLVGKGVVLPVDAYAKLLELALQEIRSAFAKQPTDSVSDVRRDGDDRNEDHNMAEIERAERASSDSEGRPSMTVVRPLPPPDPKWPRYIQKAWGTRCTSCGYANGHHWAKCKALPAMPSKEYVHEAPFEPVDHRSSHALPYPCGGCGGVIEHPGPCGPDPNYRPRTNEAKPAEAPPPWSLARQRGDRFYVDHGTVHDLKTGKHVQTGRDDALEDGTAKLCTLLNELHHSARDLDKAPSDDDTVRLATLAAHNPEFAADMAIARKWADEECRPGKERLEDAGCVEELANLIGRIRAEERARQTDYPKARIEELETALRSCIRKCAGCGTFATWDVENTMQYAYRPAFCDACKAQRENELHTDGRLVGKPVWRLWEALTRNIELTRIYAPSAVANAPCTAKASTASRTTDK